MKMAMATATVTEGSSSSKTEECHSPSSPEISRHQEILLGLPEALQELGVLRDTVPW